METQGLTKHKKYTYFIGVDVSKYKLDLAVMQKERLLFHREIRNEPEAIRTFIMELCSLAKFKMTSALFCMESTGFYSNYLVNSIKKQKGNYYIGNAAHIKLSMGLVRGKSDKEDAIRIAKFCWKNRLELQLPKYRRPVIRQLTAMNKLRTRLLGVKEIIKMPLKEQAAYIDAKLHLMCVKTCQRTMTAIENDWAALEIAIDELVSGDEKLKRLKQIIMSVPGVGRVTALQIIICTNEFKNINNPRKFACYAGVAPFKTESGIGTDLVRARISHIANKKMKSLLHICALVAIRWDEQIKNYYERKTVTEKKPKMSAINAVRNKLVSIIFACVKKDQLYLPGYISSWCECKSQTAGNGQIMPGETLTETVLACQSD